MDLPICRTCGVQYDTEHFEPDECRICTDERQYVGWDGQLWTTLPEMAAAGHRGLLQQEHGGLWGIGTDPPFAISQRALLVPGEGGNLLWDCISYLDDELVQAVAELGGIAAIAVSHPHYYGAMVEWSEAFGGAPIYVHAADQTWVCRSGNMKFWTGATHEALPGRTLINAGLHFSGGTVLHSENPSTSSGILCSGDIFTVVMDRQHVSFMYSYPNLIPENPNAIRYALRLMEPYEFDAIYGAWWARVIRQDGKAALRRSVDRYLSHVQSAGPK